MECSKLNLTFKKVKEQKKVRFEVLYGYVCVIIANLLILYIYDYHMAKYKAMVLERVPNPDAVRDDHIMLPAQ